ncbi:MAG: hypothetical protein QM488_12720 [Rhizobiaceae bacterium]
MGKEQTEPDFARIIIVDGQQVLFYIEPCGNFHTIHQIAQFDGGSIDSKLKNCNSQYVEKWFDEIATVEGARKVLKAIDDFMSNCLMGQASSSSNEGDSL